MTRVVRLVMVLKLISLARGFSGVRPQVMEALMQLLNAQALPCIPSRGSVGASGDLAPLAHMTAALLGEGHIRLKGETAAGRAGVGAARPRTLDARSQGGPRAAQWHAGLHCTWR